MVEVLELLERHHLADESRGRTVFSFFEPRTEDAFVLLRGQGLLANGGLLKAESTDTQKRVGQLAG